MMSITRAQEAPVMEYVDGMTPIIFGGDNEGRAPGHINEASGGMAPQLHEDTKKNIRKLQGLPLRSQLHIVNSHTYEWVLHRVKFPMDLFSWL